jgi:methionyl-tRNA formyltransferase
MKQRLLFFGNERLATGVTTDTPVLQALIAADYDIAAVVVAQKDGGKSRKGRQLEIAEVAEAHGIPVIAPLKLSEAIDELKAYQAEAAVLVAYGKIVPQSVIDLFPRGIINIHPSLLPKHRGPTPLESVILNDDKETGVSLMRLASDMDAGPVYAQETVLLRGDETKQSLADQLVAIGKDMLVTNLPAILDGSLEPTEQAGEPTYDKKIERDAGILTNLDFDESATSLAIKVRAYAGWPRVKATIGTSEAIIAAAHAGDAKGIPGTLYLSGSEIGFYTADGVLIIDTIIPSGRKEMSARDFLLGYKPGA